jgi:hypothetical protein
MYLLHWIPEVDWVASNYLCIRLNIQPNSINSCMCLADIFIFENDVLLSAEFEPTLLVHCRTHWMSIIYIRLTYYDVDTPSLYNITSADFSKTSPSLRLHIQSSIGNKLNFNIAQNIYWNVFFQCFISKFTHTHTHTHTHTLSTT